MKGKYVGTLPRRTRSTKHDWDTPAVLARKNPGKAVLAGEHVSQGTIQSLRYYRRPTFRNDDGHIVVNVRGSKVEDDGIRYGDVYFTWEPRDKKG